jgi:hypothetical protein
MVLPVGNKVLLIIDMLDIVTEHGSACRKQGYAADVRVHTYIHKYVYKLRNSVVKKAHQHKST